jgi:hypothetical protein
MKTNLAPALRPLLLAAALLLAGLPAASRADILYVTLGNNTIEKITSAGSGSVFASTGLNNPYGLAFDSAGNLYAANYSTNTIEKYTPGGSASVFASTGLSSTYGLAFDSAGNLYAANLGNSTIEKYTPGGVASLFANSTNGVTSSPRFLAFTNDAGVPLPLANQAPEPGSAALLTLGAGLLAARRRRGGAREEVASPDNSPAL